MRTSTESFSYNAVARLLHWLIALAIIFMLGLGWVMTHFEISNKFAWFQLHKSIGITILLLSLLRLGWRLTHAAPPLPLTMPRWEKAAATLTHGLFYFLMIVMPLTGWIMVSTSPINIPTLLYGFIPWPHLPLLPELADKKAIGNSAGWLHGSLAYLFAGLIVLHIGAAWKHHLINRDDVLTRMAPGFLHNFLNRLRGM